jgi:hypothetical protein
MKQRNLDKCRYYTTTEINEKFNKVKRIKISKLILKEMYKSD